MKAIVRNIRVDEIKMKTRRGGKFEQALFVVVFILFYLNRLYSTSFLNQLLWCLSHKESSWNDSGDVGLISGLGRFPRRRAWQPTPIFLPRESHRQRSQAGYGLQSCKGQTQLKWLSMHSFLKSIIRTDTLSDKEHTLSGIVKYKPRKPTLQAILMLNENQ